MKKLYSKMRGEDRVSTRHRQPRKREPLPISRTNKPDNTEPSTHSQQSQVQPEKVVPASSSSRRDPRYDHDYDVHSLHSQSLPYNSVHAPIGTSSYKDMCAPCECSHALPQNDGDLWDMQFCRWWGYKWLRKREEMIKQQLVKDVRRDLKKEQAIKEKYRKEKERERKEQEGVKPSIMEAVATAKGKGKKLSPEAKKGIQEYLATPCSSITYNNCHCTDSKLRGRCTSTVILEEGTRKNICKENRDNQNKENESKVDAWVVTKTDSSSSGQSCHCVSSQMVCECSEEKIQYLTLRMECIQSEEECTVCCDCKNSNDNISNARSEDTVPPQEAKKIQSTNNKEIQYKTPTVDEVTQTRTPATLNQDTQVNDILGNDNTTQTKVVETKDVHCSCGCEDGNNNIIFLQRQKCCKCNKRLRENKCVSNNKYTIPTIQKKTNKTNCCTCDQNIPETHYNYKPSNNWKTCDCRSHLLRSKSDSAIDLKVSNGREKRKKSHGHRRNCKCKTNKLKMQTFTNTIPCAKCYIDCSINTDIVGLKNESMISDELYIDDYNFDEACIRNSSMKNHLPPKRNYYYVKDRPSAKLPKYSEGKPYSSESIDDYFESYETMQKPSIPYKNYEAYKATNKRLPKNTAYSHAVNYANIKHVVPTKTSCLMELKHDDLLTKINTPIKKLNHSSRPAPLGVNDEIDYLKIAADNALKGSDKQHQKLLQNVLKAISNCRSETSVPSQSVNEDVQELLDKFRLMRSIKLRLPKHLQNYFSEKTCVESFLMKKQASVGEETIPVGTNDNFEDVTLEKNSKTKQTDFIANNTKESPNEKMQIFKKITSPKFCNYPQLDKYKFLPKNTFSSGYESVVGNSYLRTLTNDYKRNNGSTLNHSSRYVTTESVSVNRHLKNSSEINKNESNNINLNERKTLCDNEMEQIDLNKDTSYISKEVNSIFNQPLNIPLGTYSKKCAKGVIHEDEINISNLIQNQFSSSSAEQKDGCAIQIINNTDTTFKQENLQFKKNTNRLDKVELENEESLGLLQDVHTNEIEIKNTLNPFLFTSDTENFLDIDSIKKLQNETAPLSQELSPQLLTLMKNKSFCSTKESPTLLKSTSEQTHNNFTPKNVTLPNKPATSQIASSLSTPLQTKSYESPRNKAFVNLSGLFSAIPSNTLLGNLPRKMCSQSRSAYQNSTHEENILSETETELCKTNKGRYVTSPVKIHSNNPFASSMGLDFQQSILNGERFNEKEDWNTIENKPQNQIDIQTDLLAVNNTETNTSGLNILGSHQSSMFKATESKLCGSSNAMVNDNSQKKVSAKKDFFARFCVPVAKKTSDSKENKSFIPRSERVLISSKANSIVKAKDKRRKK